jgi:hypothetical protein
MKIEWLDDEFTRARLTRGLLRKKSAVVVYKSYDDWTYENGDPVPGTYTYNRYAIFFDHTYEGVKGKLAKARNKALEWRNNRKERERERQIEATHWLVPSKLPRAKARFSGK